MSNNDISCTLTVNNAPKNNNYFKIRQDKEKNSIKQ